MSDARETTAGCSLLPIDPVGSVDDLQLVAETGEGSRQRVNAFLEQVGHELGDVPGWLMAWSARHEDRIVAVLVLSRPTARAYDDGTAVEVSRMAARPERPHNTCSWLLARARTWAALSGYDRMIAYAGVAGNRGTAYDAAGFDCESVETDSTERWENREGRQSYGEYERRRWEEDLREVRARV